MVKESSNIAVIGYSDVSLIRKVENLIESNHAVKILSVLDSYNALIESYDYYEDNGTLLEDMFNKIVDLIDTADALVIIIPSNTDNQYVNHKEFNAFLTGYAWSQGIPCIYYCDNLSDGSMFFFDIMAKSLQATLHGQDALKEYDFVGLPLVAHKGYISNYMRH